MNIKSDKAIVFDGEYMFSPFDEGNSEDEWSLPYRKFELDYDYEEIYKEMIPVVEEEMKEMDISIGKIKRNVTSIKTIEDSLKGFNKEQKEKFLEKIETKLDEIEDDIQEMIDRGDASHEERSKEYEEGNADGIGNLTFKSLQKHGYIWLYVNLKKLLEDDEEITINEVDDIEKILKEEKQMAWLSKKAKEQKVEDKEIQKELSNLGDKLQAKLIGFNTLTQSFIDDADDLSLMAKSSKVDKKKVEKAIKDSKTIYSQIQDITPMLNKLETLS